MWYEIESYHVLHSQFLEDLTNVYGDPEKIVSIKRDDADLEILRMAREYFEFPVVIFEPWLSHEEALVPMPGFRGMRHVRKARVHKGINKVVLINRDDDADRTGWIPVASTRGYRGFGKMNGVSMEIEMV